MASGKMDDDFTYTSGCNRSNDNMVLKKLLCQLKKKVFSQSNKITEFRLPTEYFTGIFLNSNNLSTTNNNDNSGWKYSVSNNNDFQNVIREFNKEVFAKCKTVKEFSLPKEFHILDIRPNETYFETSNDDGSTDFILPYQDTVKLQDVLSRLKQEIITESSMIKEFSLPLEYLVGLLDKHQGNSRDIQLEGRHEQSSSNDIDLHYVQHDSIQYEQNRFNFLDNSTGSVGLISLSTNLHSECSNTIQMHGQEICGCQFDLNVQTCNQMQRSIHQNLPSERRKMRRKRSLSSRMCREKDKKRKRMERQRKVAFDVDDESKGFDNSFQNCSKVNNINMENFVYKEQKSLSQYKNKKSAQQRHRYLTQSSYKNRKISAGKKRYRDCEEYRLSLRSRSIQKYRDNKKHRQAIIQTGVYKYRENLQYQQALKQASIQKYKEDLTHKQAVRLASVQKYRDNAKHKQAVRLASVQKYRDNAKHKQAVRLASVQKYRDNAKHKQAVRLASVQKYRDNAKHKQAVRLASVQKYRDNAKHKQAVRLASVQKYRDNAKHKQAVRLASVQKYRDNAKHKQAVRLASVQKYRDNAKHKKAVRLASVQKYRDNAKHKQAVRLASIQKYRDNVMHKQMVRLASIKKYKENAQHREAVKKASVAKYAQNKLFQNIVRRASRYKYCHNILHRQQLREIKRAKYRRCAITREKCKQRLLLQYKNNAYVRQRKIKQSQERRVQRKKNSEISDFFKMEVKDGPLYVCCVCHKFKFKKQVVVCDHDKYLRKGTKSSEMAEKCISYKFQIRCTNECSKNCETLNHGKLWICYCCHRNLLEGKMPADAEANNLQLKVIPQQLQTMNALEKQLLSLRIPFMKLVSLPKGAQRGMVGPCVSVPTDIEKTTKVLPRCHDENQLIRVKLKRKLPFKGHHQYQFISTNRVSNGLEYLQQHNPWYRNTSLHPSWQGPVTQDVAEININEAQPLVGSSDEDPNCTDNDSENVDEDQSLKDRGMPLDTCLQPVDIGQEILDQYFDDIFCIAPGEGNTPVSMLREEGNEAMSFPVQFPDGNTGTYDAARPVHLTRARYFHARLLNADNRFSSDSAYIFYAQYLSELEQVISKVSIALRKSAGTDTSGRKITADMLTDKSSLKNLLKTDQGYKFMTPIRGTPPYWQATLNDLMAMIRQLGIPTWFCTFSAADMRWIEILQVLLHQRDSTRLVSELDWNEKCDVLRNNPIMNAVMFDHRFHTFLREVIINRQVIGKIKDFFYRIEFQQRGSPHAHCLFWIEDAPVLDKDDDESVCNFVNKYVTCALPDLNENSELHEIASSVQQHSKNHSKSCKKKNTTCRFNFPRAPSEKTFICRTQSLTDPSQQSSPQQVLAKSKIILNKLWEVLKNVPLDTTTQNLFAAVGITQQEFEDASNVLTKRTSIVLQRKPSDVWVNQYNPTLLQCWNANMDIQFITDAYSCVMYIISYISKAEREMGLVLDQAQKEASEGNLDAQEAMKKIGGAYFRQREVSAQEAAYRVCGLHLKEASRKVQFIPAGDNQVRMSLPLKLIQTKSQELDDSDVWMSSFYDKYKARPVSQEFERLCYASFSSEYRILASSQIPKGRSKTNVHKLQNDLGYIQKRTRTEAAVVRYPRFKLKKNPELYYKSNMQLFLPHRHDHQLKPNNFETYEEFYSSGAVSIASATPEAVKTVVECNKQNFEQNADKLDEAQELIERVGPLEDAWALIGPQSESERLESEKEREPVLHEEEIQIPELQSSNKRQQNANTLEFNSCKFSSQQIKPLLQSLNQKQKLVFYRIRQWCLDKVNGKHPEPFRLYINGGAGTGKSHLIKCLHYEAQRILAPHASSPDDVVVLLTAPTATAAFNIGGTTLHQAFSLTKSLPLPYHYKRDEELNTLRSKLQGLEILIIDEISMVGQRLLTYVNERLRQIKQSRNAVFGNVCVIAVGDFYQLPPVKQKCLFDLRPENYFPLWSSNFETVELQQIMRQKGDSTFAEILNRLRVKKKTEKLNTDDVLTLEACSQNSVPPETLHIFATNAEVKSHNKKMIDVVCDVTQTISAQDYDKDPQSSRLTPRDTPYDTTNDYLPSQLTLGPRARVMLIRNVDISVGLVNGAIGTVITILPPKSGSLMPRAVQIVFDNEHVGGKQTSITSDHRRPINIEPIEEKLKNNAVRYQFPLQLAWGCTTHKVQGLTTDAAVVSFKHIFAAGMAYVALSRVTSMSGLVIKDFDQSKIYCIEQISDSLEKMPKFLANLNLNSSGSGKKVVLHNVQGLIPHFDDVVANTDIADADIICLTETWLKPNSVSPQLHNYDFAHSPRTSSYTSTSPLFQKLKDQIHGGVGAFFHKDQQCNYIQLDSCNIEAMALYMKELNANLVIVYRPETYPASAFLEHLHQYLQLLPQASKATIVIGDFNQDILKSGSSIKQYMEKHGFKQLMDKSTTDGGTLIDHVYVRGTLNVTVDTLPAYYSYHNIVTLRLSTH